MRLRHTCTVNEKNKADFLCGSHVKPSECGDVDRIKSEGDELFEQEGPFAEESLQAEVVHKSEKKALVGKNAAFDQDGKRWRSD